MDPTRTDAAPGADQAPADPPDAAREELDVRRMLAALHGDGEDRLDGEPPPRRARRRRRRTRTAEATP
jgi:hypothetical protein